MADTEYASGGLDVSGLREVEDLLTRAIGSAEFADVQGCIGDALGLVSRMVAGGRCGCEPF